METNNGVCWSSRPASCPLCGESLGPVTAVESAELAEDKGYTLYRLCPNCCTEFPSDTDDVEVVSDGD